MKVLIIGSGGREHAIAWKIKQSPQLTELYCAPGNPGISRLAETVSISPQDLQGLLDWAVSKNIDLTVVGPEAPLVEGIADLFRKAGQRVAGPGRLAARLEGSKAFAKDFMRRHSIPTGHYEIFDEADQAEKTLRDGAFKFPVVLKADGLAAGKGVFVCPEVADALEALATIMRARKFGAAGDKLLVEEFLEGEEASFMVFSDGGATLPMVPSQDHKAAYEGDRGPNTGGMGAYSTDDILGPDLQARIMNEIISPTVKGMAKEGNPYSGVLYAGLMITREGPKVLEYNVRLGDPEAQVVLPRMESDLLTILDALADTTLESQSVNWSSQASVCVVVASEGYPGAYPKGLEISGLELANEEKDTVVFHAGTGFKDDRIVTQGGRVLGVTSMAPTLESAIIRTYEGVNKIHFEKMYYRRDIASKGLKKIGKEPK